MKTLYLAKGPDAGVRNDLSRLSGKVTIVDCLNTYGRWYRKKGYNCISKDEFFNSNDMRFDTVIGNPPFQEPGHKGKTSSLWKKFLDKSYEMSDTVSLIIPASFTSPSTFFAKYKKNLKVLDLTVKKYFKGVGSSFCMIMLTKEQQPHCKVISDGGTYKIDFSDWDCVPSYLNDEIMGFIDSYFTGGGREWKVSYDYESRKKVFCDTGRYEIIHSTKTFYSNKHAPQLDTIKVYCTLTNGTKFKTATVNQGFTQNAIWTPCDSMDEAEELVSKLNDVKVQKLLKVFQYSNINYPKVINKLNIK